MLQETLLFMIVIFLLWRGFCCYAQIAQYLLSALRPPGPPGLIFGFSKRNDNCNGYFVVSNHYYLYLNIQSLEWDSKAKVFSVYL